MLQKSWSQTFSDLCKNKKFLIATGVGVTLGIGFAMWHYSKEKPSESDGPKFILSNAESNSERYHRTSSEATQQDMPADNINSTMNLATDGPLSISNYGAPIITDNRSKDTSYEMSPGQSQIRSKQASQEILLNQSGSKIKVDPKLDPEEEVLGLIKDFHQAASLDPSKLNQKP
jgi:hypothetical protein